jgi:hypothetical protein
MKEAKKHTDIACADYTIVQQILDCGEAIKEGRKQYNRRILY